MRTLSIIMIVLLMGWGQSSAEQALKQEIDQKTSLTFSEALAMVKTDGRLIESIENGGSDSEAVFFLCAAGMQDKH